ncbi:uncharacterized protein [Palaemon carinicauda]|uniref:uncharacterized protein n=1 Tax=Palaemon carinicauda TaxID=392227 RepID=UPI0035B69659
MEHLEVMPISMRVVCLNAPYLKSLCVFEALSRTLGCYYNHHRPQVVSCHTTVRLPAPRIVKVRGHASHAHTPCDTPTIHTTIQMGTYLAFYLKDWSEIHKCHLIINGIEKVSKAKAPVPPNILLERVIDSNFPSSNIDQEKNLTNGSLNNSQEGTRLNEALLSNNTNNMAIVNETILSNTTQGIARVAERLLSRARISDKVFNANTLPKPSRIIKSTAVKDTNTYTTTSHTLSKATQNGKTHSIDNYPTKLQEKDRMSDNAKDNREKPNTNTILSINMDQSEEITTLLDDDNDDDSEYTSDTSDDLHKVVRKRLSIDITSLIHSCPSNNILVLLMKPAEETQAWQFLSTCMKVTHFSTKTLVTEGTGTIKKALTRTRPLYFSKNGNAQRL